MEQSTDFTRRNFLASVLGTAGLGALSVPTADAAARIFSPDLSIARIPTSQIGLQFYTLRSILPDDMLGLENGLELVQDVGISNLEVAGIFWGRTPQELRELAAQHGIRIAGNHFGPRSMAGENPWYDESGRAEIFKQAPCSGA